MIAPRGPDYTELTVDACSAVTGDGSVKVGPKGLACVYTAPDEAGTDGFTMDVTDVIGQSATQTVRVTVTEDGGTGTDNGGGNDNGGDDGGTGSGGNGGNNGDGDGGTGTDGGGGNDSGDGTPSGGAGETDSTGDDLAFTGTPYFLVPAIAAGFALILFGTGLLSAETLRARRRPGRGSIR